MLHPDFDLEKAKEAAEHYHTATGVGCIIIDEEGSTLFSIPSNAECTICSLLKNKSSIAYSCRESHKYGSYQAERFGGRYIYFCPMSLLHWASPLVLDGTSRGALIGGPVLVIEPEEYILDELIRRHHVSNEHKHINEVKEFIHSVPYITTTKVRSLSQQLYITSLFITDTLKNEYVDTDAALSQQSRISEYIHYLKQTEGQIHEKSAYPLEKEKELLRLIASADKEGSLRVMNEILGHIFFQSGNDLNVIKARIQELVVLLSRAAVEGGADVEEIFGLNYKYLTQIHRYKSLDDLSYWLAKILSRFSDLVFDLRDIKHADVMMRTIRYLNQNYAERITLDEISDYNNLSPSYFSKIFKEEMQTNFKTYLNKIRIEKSKDLLLESDIPLADMASVVGFEGQSYFTKVFKKTVGISPGRFRETRGRISIENQEIHD